MRFLPAVVVAISLCLNASPGWGQSEVDRLAALARVWGFLKYYHPGVAMGTIHWDSALVAAVPVIRAAQGDAQFRAAISALLDAAGPVTWCEATNRTSTCRAPGADSLRRNLDLRWIPDSATFGPGIVQRLLSVRDSRHVISSRFVGFRITALFDRDTAYSSPAYPPDAQRLLGLFRFWNAARYWFPYMYVNDGDWNTVLPEFIPRVLGARNATEYHMAMMEATTRLNDAHVGAASPVIFETLGTRSPSFEARWVDSQLVVWKPAPDAGEDGLLAGDVITRIDGKPVAELRQQRAKYVAAGNPAVFDRKLVSLVTRVNGNAATYTFDRDGVTFTRRVVLAGLATAGARPTFPVNELAKMLPGNIGYINMGDINLNQVDSAMAIVQSAPGIVVDVRNYPRGTMYRFAQLLNPTARPFVRFTYVDSTYPGQVQWSSGGPAGMPTGNPGHYRGRVAILVDERTQSHAEFTVMALRTSPENKVIGSQTAGADGNVTSLLLPGGIRVAFTGLGVYYPDGTPTQRIGIVPDIVIRPTLAGFRAGRDEVLERAIEYIRTGR